MIMHPTAMVTSIADAIIRIRGLSKYVAFVTIEVKKTTQTDAQPHPLHSYTWSAW